MGPCTVGDNAVGKTDLKSAGAGIGVLAQSCTADELLAGTKVPLDVFSYYCYNGVSERFLQKNVHFSENKCCRVKMG